jgi:ferredoxin
MLRSLPPRRGGGRRRNDEEVVVKVVVDFDVCASNAVCMGIVPEVFEVRDDGFLYVLDEHPPAELHDKVREAVNDCPTGAISLVEDD